MSYGEDPFLLCAEWKTLRMRALERGGAKCACCGRSAADGARMNVDHIKPRRFYPELALTLDNLQVLCSDCNHGKGNKYETDWRRESSRIGFVTPMQVDEVRVPAMQSRLEQLAQLKKRIAEGR